MRKRIVVVEDFATTRNFICETLHARGYDSVGVGNIRDAWATILLTATDVDLVISDYHMPDGSGLELLKKVKANAATRAIPVIFLTCETDAQNTEEAKAEGLHSWIVKPYLSTTFFATINAALSTNS
jgi:two-component system, chemotaxis family, chemotaxis protein CheY